MSDEQKGTGCARLVPAQPSLAPQGDCMGIVYGLEECLAEDQLNAEVGDDDTDVPPSTCGHPISIFVPVTSGLS